VRAYIIEFSVTIKIMGVPSSNNCNITFKMEERWICY